MKERNNRMKRNMKKSSKLLLLLMCLMMAQADSIMAASAEETSSISQKCAENVSKIQNVVEGSFTETPMYTTVHLNFRTEPSKESSVQTVLPKYQEVVQLEEANADGWCKISYKENT